MFNLVEEPWIPVIWRERPKGLGETWSDGPARGRAREKRIDDWRSEIGILDALNCAGQIREIYDTSPLVTFGIHRLLLAILHAANVHGENADIQHGADKYLEKRTRLRLFDMEYPFLQNISLSPRLATQNTRKSTATLYAELAKGTNIAHFSHLRDGLSGLSPAMCARGVLLQSSHTGNSGKGFKDAINGSTPVYLFPLADTLGQTLRLNLSPVARHNGDAPAWECTPRSTGCVGYLEGLFWPARAVLLQQPADGLVLWIVYDQGKSSDDINEGPNTARLWHDPHATVVRPKANKKVEWTRLLAPKPLEPQGDWHAWRRVLSDIEENGKPPSLSSNKQAEGSVVGAVLLAHDGKGKFYHSSSLRLPLPTFCRTAGEKSKAFFECASNAASKGLWANNPKRKANRETYRPLAGFNPAEFELTLFQEFLRLQDQAKALPSEDELMDKARSASRACERIVGLPWRELSTIQESGGLEDEDDLKDALKRIRLLLNRLADRKRVPLSDLALLRRAKVHADLDAAPLTDLLNEHVREFKGLRRRTAWMIARLFAHDTEQGRFGNMGEHLRSLRWAVSGKNRERLEREFEHLLYTPFEQLELSLARWIMRLRQARRSNPQKHRCVHWEQLYHDLDHWGEGVRAEWRAAFR